MAGFFLTWEDGDYIEFAFNVDIRVVGAKFYVEHQLWPCYYKWYGVRASGSWWFVCSVEGAIACVFRPFLALAGPRGTGKLERCCHDDHGGRGDWTGFIAPSRRHRVDSGHVRCDL